MKLFEKYQLELKPKLKQELSIKNLLAVPKLDKIILSVGLGEALQDAKVLERVSQQLMQITGQKPKVTQAKVSIASFKLRAGDKIGLKVTLRNQRMYDFLEKLIRIVLPRVRDFRGLLKTHFDSHGNYNLGLAEIAVFPEIDYAKIDKIRGLQITIVTKAKSKIHAEKLLDALGMPFVKDS